MKRSVVATVALVASCTGLARATAFAQENADADSTHWRWYVTPYAWASGVRGDMGVRGRNAHVDLSFSEIIPHLDAAFMLPIEVRKGKLGFQLEVLYTKVSNGAATPGPLFSTASLAAKTFMSEFGPLFRVYTTDKAMVDVLADIRWWKLDNTLTFNPGLLPGVHFDFAKGWIDAVGGARGFYKITPHWVLHGRGDLGALQSDFTWQLIGDIGYIINNTATVRAGYRQLDVDFDDGRNQFLYDVGMGGPIIGATFRF